MQRIMMLALVLLMNASVVSAAGPEKGQLSGTVNINTATAAELMLLPGIGKSKADAIVARRQGAAFVSPQDLGKVKGIGDKLFARIQNYVRIDGPTTLKFLKAQPAQAPGNVIVKPGS
jgi:competence protein ComEA